VFRQVLGREAARVIFVSAPSDDFSATNWWRTKAGLQSISSEYLKFAYYLLRYGDWRVWTILAGVAAWPAVRVFRRVRRPGHRHGLSPDRYQAISTPAVGP
jgi:hypothetical protein